MLRLTSEELAAAAVLHAEIKMVFRLKRMIERDNERVIARRQDFLLGQRPLDFVPLDHLLFAEHCATT